ncbi:MAG: TolC family protein [Sulfurospirillaceae bacterium]|jgi:outer membrane protein TolC|nr:TolC family protein [Sulfurospirillaceae bacterium]MDD2826754.1 TolC family protein [Sulfurospirillaceae bacterium]
MKRLLFLLIPALMCADDLKSLLEFATTHNNMVVAKSLREESKLKEIESTQSAYYPTLDVGGYGQSLNARTGNTPGDIYSGYAKVGVDIYDGGKKSSTIEQNKALLESSKYDTSAYKKNLQLLIVQDFYTIKSVEANLKALEEKQVQLNADLERIKKFYEVGSATSDEIDKLQAALSNNGYQIDATKFQILSLTRLLGVKIGKKITTLEASNVEEPQNVQKELSDEIQALSASASSLSYSAQSLNAAYMPQIRLEDTYSLYDYDRYDALHPEGLNNQNKLMLTFNIRLFDNGTVSKQKESLFIQQKALESEIKQNTEIQDINADLSLSKISTTKAQIQSAKSSLDAAMSAYDVIAKKYELGAVDNIAYLDALSVKTNAKAQYEEALNNLQIAYASYYYYANKNIKEYTK